MNKLTQQEAQDLITKAWKMVSDQNLGQYRFGQCLWFIIPQDKRDEYALFDTDYTPPLFNGYHRDVDFYYEECADIALAKFYQYFVDNSNNQLDS